MRTSESARWSPTPGDDSRRPLIDRRSESGPFDVVGDVHGCREELEELLAALDYVVEGGAHRHRGGRRAVFLGDLVDRGPDTPGVLRLVMAMHAAGSALCLPGNHDVKLMRALRGASVKVAHGLAQSLEQMATQPPEFRTIVADWIESLPSHLILDDGRLVVAHAGMREDLQGRDAARTLSFALYGETTGERDEYGLPIRGDWAARYGGAALVVYGHTAMAEPRWLHNTVCIDTGCVYGGHLSALRYPERDVVSVPARRQHYAPIRPLPGGSEER